MIRLRDIASWPIVLYQKTFSYDHGPMKRFFPFGFCPFYPSCSEYCRLSLLKYGIIFGMPRCVWRILRCHPWTKGGIDKP